MLENSCLVVAHPDDEILWFSAVLRRVERVVICFLSNPAFPGRGEARRRVLDRHPVRGIECLGLRVPLTRQWCDWADPAETSLGVRLPEMALPSYERSFAELRRKLRDELSTCANVITHNPWGEYGHEMHVQVHRVIRSIADEAGFRVWFSNYVSSRSETLAKRHLFGPYVEPICLATDTVLAHQVRDLYLAEGCWTVPGGFAWFDEECYNCSPTVGEHERGVDGRMFPLNHVLW